MTILAPLRRFLVGMTHLVEQTAPPEQMLLSDGRELLAELIMSDTWLPAFCAVPNPEQYCQYLLYCDPLERFSVVSFVWGPGQATPIHDHTVWGLVGMLRGAESSERFVYDGGLRATGTDRLEPGMIDAVSPHVGDIHRVSNAYEDRTSISIHVYGANIGSVRRHVYDEATGQHRDFTSGYANDRLPNPWAGAPH